MAYRRTPRVQARLDATRDALVTAAVGRVADGGWAAVTVTDVARDAQVATGTVYRHFDDKDALLAAAFRRAAGRELQVVADAADSDVPPIERLAAALRVFAERALKGRRLAYALLAEPAGTAVEAERLTYRRGYCELFAGVLVDGIADGSVTPHDVEVVAAALVGACGEVLVTPVAPANGADAAAAAADAAGPTPGVVADAAAPLAATADRVDALVATCLRAVPTTSTSDLVGGNP